MWGNFRYESWTVTTCKDLRLDMRLYGSALTHDLKHANKFWILLWWRLWRWKWWWWRNDNDGEDHEDEDNDDKDYNGEDKLW